MPRVRLPVAISHEMPDMPSCRAFSIAAGITVCRATHAAPRFKRLLMAVVVAVLLKSTSGAAEMCSDKPSALMLSERDLRAELMFM